MQGNTKAMAAGGIICSDDNIECKLAYITSKVEAVHILMSNHLQHHQAVELAIIAMLGVLFVKWAIGAIRKNGKSAA